MAEETVVLTPFQRWLRAYIDRSQSTMSDCADRFGVGDSIVSLWLSGQRSPSYAYLLAIRRRLPDIDVREWFDEA